VYANPRIRKLAYALVALVHPVTDSEAANAMDAVRAMINKYTRDLPQMSATSGDQPELAVVLLTGSTGGLGSQLLATLLSDDRVGLVYALNRPSTKATSLARHQETFRDRSAL
jgi:hypothetical protein